MMISDNLYEGRYSPRNAYGKWESHNIYIKTREECVEKLAAMIVQIKADINAEKERLKTMNKSFTLEADNETLLSLKIASHKTKNTTNPYSVKQGVGVNFKTAVLTELDFTQLGDALTPNCVLLKGRIALPLPSLHSSKIDPYKTKNTTTSTP